MLNCIIITHFLTYNFHKRLHLAITLKSGGVVLYLSVRQSDILTNLVQNINRTVERETILQTLWGNDSYTNSLALNVQITYL